MELEVDDYLEVLRREYLQDFIKQGGAAVKVAVTPDELTRERLTVGLRDAAQTLGFQFVAVDAFDVRIHLVDKLFQAVARQIDWDQSARVFLENVLSEHGCRLPTDAGAFSIKELAAINELPEPVLRIDVERWLFQDLWKDYAMSEEFRLAMVRLCRGQLDPDEDPEASAAVKDWLIGELRSIGPLKRALITQRIGRHNARNLLYSLGHWLALTGKSGLVVCLDIERVLIKPPRREARDAGQYYSNPALLDAYEVLRQFIDGTDELEHCFILAVASSAFVSDPQRGYDRYHALRLRLADEVRIRRRQNPLSAMVRLGPALQVPTDQVGVTEARQ